MSFFRNFADEMPVVKDGADTLLVAEYVYLNAAAVKVLST